MTFYAYSCPHQQPYISCNILGKVDSPSFIPLFTQSFGEVDTEKKNRERFAGCEKWMDGRLCGCGKLSQMRTSWTTTNPGRRFAGCEKYGVSSLGFSMGLHFVKEQGFSSTGA